MKGKLAVLIPAFNGAQLLRRSVDSCAASGLSASRYEIIVVDNYSTDGSAADFPDKDATGARLQVIRNERNLGRVGNWNRALELAALQGFDYATFLFVGDEWLPDGSLPGMLDAMDASHSVLGMAPLRIPNEGGGLVRNGARISITGRIAYTDSTRLLNDSIGTGRLPFAPVQANIYRLFEDRPLRFDTDERNELNADLEGTAAYLKNHPGPVTLMSEPYLIWRERGGRFFATQNPWVVFTETRKSLQHLSGSLGIPVDWRSANAIAMLAALREPSQAIPLLQRLAFASRVFQYLRRDEAGLSLLRMAGFVWRKLRSGQSYLVISAGPSSTVAPPSAIRALPDQCGY